MPTPQRLPIVNADDGTWGDIIRQYIAKEHYNDDTDNTANGGHQKITIRPGTAAAGTAPLKFASGTLLATPEAGAIEFNGDTLYFTQTTGPTRKKLAAYDDAAGATGDLYYRNAAGAFTRLAAGSAGDFLTIASGIPSWTADIVGKTISASNNTISNIAVANMATSAVVTESEGISSNDNDTTLPTSAAVKDYADTLAGSLQNAFMMGTVATAAGTVAKAVTLNSPWNTKTPSAGDWFLLNFTNGQTVSSPTLSINGGSAYPIQTAQAQTNSSNTSIAAGNQVLLLFDGSRYILPGATLNTTYSTITDAEIINTASTAARLMTGQRAETLMANEATVSRTLANKTLTAPRIANAGFIADSNGNEQIVFNATAGAVNEISVTNATTGNAPRLSAQGSDTNVHLDLYSKGSGAVRANGVNIPTISSADTLTNKTLTSPVINGTVTGTGVSSSPTASTLVLRDSNGNVSANAFVHGFTTTPTSAGVRTLSIIDDSIQEFTGTNTHTVRLPTTSIVAGARYTVINSSTGAVTVQSSGTNTISTLPGGTSATFTALVATPTTAANWESTYINTGDTSSNTTTSVDGEVALFSGTGGKTIKRATGTGIAKLTSGVLSTATAGTDYVTPAGAEILTNKTINGSNNTISNVPQSAVTNLVSDLAGKASTTHTHTASQISDSSTVGRSVLTAADAAAARTAIGAGTGSGDVTLTGAQTLTNKTISGSNNTITNLAATSVTSGAFPMARIGIGDFENIAAGSDFETEFYPWSLGTGRTIASDFARSGTYSYKFTAGAGNATYTGGTIEVKEGEQLYCECWVRRDADYNATDARIRLGAMPGNGNVANLSFNAATVPEIDTWVKRSFITNPYPAGNVAVNPSIVMTGLTAGNLWIDDIVIRRVKQAETIPNLDASKITAGTLPVARGGTGATTLTGILKGNGTGAFTAVAAPTGALVGTTDVQTLTNKTLSAPVLSGIITGTYSLTGATLNSAKMDTIFDPLGNTILQFSAFSSAVNYMMISNAMAGDVPMFRAAGNDTNIGIRLRPKGSGNVLVYAEAGQTPTIQSEGPDTNLNLNLLSKGTGTVQANGVDIVTVSGTQTLAGKTLTTPTIASFANASHNHTNAAGGGQLTASTALSATGTPSSSTYLRGDNTWATITASGDASTNTATSVDGELALFSGTTGKQLKRATGSGIATLSSGVLSTTATTGSGNVVLASSPTLTTPVINGIPSGTGVSVSSTANTLALRDANGNLSANALLPGFTTTPTAAGITTMTIASDQIQVFTGTSTQTVRLPTTGVVAGGQYRIINNSNGAVTVQSSAGNTITVLAANTSGLFNSLQAAPTSNTHWDGQYWGTAVAWGKTLAVSNTLTLAGTDGTTMTFPNASGTVVTTAASQALTTKTINLGSNTLTGTTAQFNAALSDNLFATQAGVETLSNKTLASPTFTGTYSFGGTPTWPTFNQNTTGSAATLATPRTIGLSGAATGTATSFDGSGNITIPVTALNASNLNAGTLPDARVTGMYTGFTHKIDGANTVFTTPNSGSTNNLGRTVYGLAEYRSNSATQTGAIVFYAPNTTSSIMHQLEISGLLYNQNIVQITVQGYRTTGTWSDTRKISTGTVDVQVRWGVDPSGKNCLILGDIATSWSYPHLSIVRAMFSHTGTADAYVTGWTVGVVTDLTSFTQVTSDIANSVMVGNVSGNAATATTLQTARTIGGVSFNGSANINLPGVNTTGNQNTTGSAATLTTGRTFQTDLASTASASFNGSANVTPGVTGTLGVANGGSGRATATTAYGLIAAGTSATGAQQTIAPGTAGQFLKSAGASALASFASISAADISDSTATGRSVLTATDAAAARSAIGAGTGNGDVTLAGAQSLTNKTISGSTNTISVADANFTIQDDVDPTKTVKFSVGALPTGAALNLNAPNVTGGNHTLVSRNSTDIMLNKRIQPRTLLITSSATPSIDTDDCDFVSITALATNVTSMTTNLIGAPEDGEKILFRIKDNGTPRSITWGAKFQASGVAAPLTNTVSGREHHVLFVYSVAATKWVCLAVDSVGY